MKQSTYKIHRIILAIAMLMYVPLAADLMFDLGIFGRTGKGILLAMSIALAIYFVRFGPTREDMDEYRKQRGN